MLAVTHVASCLGRQFAGRASGQEVKLHGKSHQDIELPSNSYPVEATVRIHHSGPKWTVGRTVFEMWLGAL